MHVSDTLDVIAEGMVTLAIVSLDDWEIHGDEYDLRMFWVEMAIAVFLYNASPGQKWLAG